MSWTFCWRKKPSRWKNTITYTHAHTADHYIFLIWRISKSISRVISYILKSNFFRFIVQFVNTARAVLLSYFYLVYLFMSFFIFFPFVSKFFFFNLCLRIKNFQKQPQRNVPDNNSSWKKRSWEKLRRCHFVRNLVKGPRACRFTGHQLLHKYFYGNSYLDFSYLSCFSIISGILIFDNYGQRLLLKFKSHYESNF